MANLSKTYNFTDPDDFTNTSKIANGSLVIQDNPGNDFQEDFADDTDFTYDSDKAEFSGGQVQQKDQRPANATFYASFTSDINGNWGDGTLTGSAVGGAAVVSEQLDLAHDDVRYVEYDADGNADSQQTGCIRFKITPNYTGAPSANKSFYVVGKQAGSLWNLIQIHQDSIGRIRISIYNSTGGVIFDNVLDTWLPTADTPYEFEFNWDITIGASRFFIDGTQLGSTITDTGTRDSDINFFRIGTTYDAVDKSDFYIEDVLIFSTVQHTANYTPDWSDVYETIYVESEVVLPEMEYTGAGTLIAATAFTTSFGGSPRLTLEIGRSGDELYWNGSAWAVSDGTYAQATDPATFAANVASLPVNGEIYGQFKIYFTDTNTQGTFADLLITLTAQIYPTDDPYIISNNSIGIDDIISITEIVSKSGNDDISRVCIVDGNPYYHDGSDWVTSDYSYAQSNTVAEILAAIDNLVGDGITSFLMAYIFHSDDGSTTPTISTDVVVYDFFGGIEDAPNECIVYGTMRDEDGDAVENGVVTVSPSNTKALYNNNQLTLSQKTTLTRANGYWEVALPETTNMDIHFTFTFSNDNTHREYPRIIPNENTKEFGDLEAPA